MYKFNGFTSRAVSAINNAIVSAQELGHTYIGSEHLLLGLLREGSGAAFTILTQCRVTLARAEEQVTLLIGCGEPTRLSPEDFTPRCSRILEEAVRESQNGAFLQAGTEHLLLAVASERECYAVRCLEKLGVSADSLCRSLRETIRLEQCEQPVQEKQPPRVTGKAVRNTKSVLLERFGRDLTEQARLGKLDPVIGRERETERLLQVLTRRTKNNPCLIGEAGVGKTAIVEGLAQQIAEGRVPGLLEEKRVIALDMTAMVAGTKYRGDFEERIRGVLEEVVAAGDVILFIDEIHTIMGIGAAEGAVDAANIMKPRLARGDLQVIGATTIAEYRKTIEKDAALARRFQSVLVEEPSEANTIAILQGLRTHYEKHHGLVISQDAIEAAVKLSVRYFPTRFLPDKAIDLLDEAAARLHIAAVRSPALRRQPCTAAAGRASDSGWPRVRENGRRPVLDREGILETVTAMTGITLGKPTDTEAMMAEQLGKGLRRTMVGQEEAVRLVTHAILRSRVGLRDPRRPIGSFLFLGPSGVGKTQLCFALAETLFGSADHIVKLDMSEYQEPHSISRLIGAPPGYVGCEEGGILTEAVRKRPMSVVVFDEIEKAHPDLFNILLQILEDGRLTDSQGRLCLFRNAVVILTSNIGAQFITGTKNLGFSTGTEVAQDAKAAVLSELRRQMRPELLGRIDETVLFHCLSPEELHIIARQLLDEVTVRLREQEITVTFAPEVIDRIASAGDGKTLGARPLRRAVRTLIEDALTEELLSGRIAAGDSILCGIEGEKLTILPQKAPFLFPA